jgi:hypothetical protein
MARGGKRPGAGRRAGQRVRSTAVVSASGPIDNVSAAARIHTAAALAALVAVMNDERSSASARATAAIGLLDRGWGRAPQTIDVSGQVEVVDAVSELEIARRIAFLLEKGRRRIAHG